MNSDALRMVPMTDEVMGGWPGDGQTGEHK